MNKLKVVKNDGIGRGIILVLISVLVFYSLYLMLFRKTSHEQAVLKRATRYEIINDFDSVSYKLNFQNKFKEIEVDDLDLFRSNKSIKVYENDILLFESKIYLFNDVELLKFTDKYFIIANEDKY